MAVAIIDVEKLIDGSNVKDAVGLVTGGNAVVVEVINHEAELAISGRNPRIDGRLEIDKIARRTCDMIGILVVGVGVIVFGRSFWFGRAVGVV